MNNINDILDIKEESDSLNSIRQPFPVNPTAEKIINLTAIIYLAISIFCFISLLIYSILEFLRNSGIQEESVLSLALAFGILFSGFIYWAFIKVLCNISNNLYNINSKLK